MIGAGKLISASIASTTVDAGNYGFNVLSFANRSYGRALVTDSAGNIIVCGYSYIDSTTVYQGFLLKYNPQRELIWSKKYPIGMLIFECAIDLFDNIYVCGQYQITGGTTITGFFQKLSSEGVSVFGGQQYNTSTVTAYRGIKIDSSGSIYVAGYTTADGAGSYDILATKYSSSGVISWTKTLGTAATDYSFNMFLSEELDTIAIAGYTTSGSYGTSALIATLSGSTGSLLAKRTIDATNTTLFDTLNSIALDTTGNIYAVGQSTVATGITRGRILKLNSVGTLLWSITLSQTLSDNTYFTSVYFDPEGNLIIVGGSADTPNGLILLRTPQDGTVLDFKKKLVSTALGSPYSYVDSSGDVYFTAVDNVSTVVVGKLPLDGSGNGTYGSITYSDNTFTTYNYTSIVTNPTVTIANAVMTTSGFAPALIDLAVSETFYPLTV